MTRNLQQLFHVEDEVLIPAASKEELGAAVFNGISLLVDEWTNPTQRDLERYKMKPVEAFCVIKVLNHR